MYPPLFLIYYLLVLVMVLVPGTDFYYSNFMLSLPSIVPGSTSHEISSKVLAVSKNLFARGFATDLPLSPKAKIIIMFYQPLNFTQRTVNLIR